MHSVVDDVAGKQCIDLRQIDRRHMSGLDRGIIAADFDPADPQGERPQSLENLGESGFAHGAGRSGQSA